MRVTICFDRTRLEKLTEILERLNKEIEDFRKTDINEETAENGKSDRPPKEKRSYDYMSTASKIINRKCNFC